MDFLKDVNIKDVLSLMLKFTKLLFTINICSSNGLMEYVWIHNFFYISDTENDVNGTIFCSPIIPAVDKEREQNKMM